MAATRRGCVHPILPLLVYPASARYCVICVVFPDPVSPMTTSTWLSFTAAMSSSRSLKMGRLSRCCVMVRLLRWPKVGALPKASFFHSGISYWPMPVPRSSAARWRSPDSGMGSSQGRLRSFGTASWRVRCCWSFSSRRSLASADCVMAARCRLPSGFFTILMGDMSRLIAAWAPRRNGASTSLSSISTASSASCSMLSNPAPSSSNVGYSDTFSTPEAISCCASHLSGEDSRFWGRRTDESFRSSSLSLIPESPLSEFCCGCDGLDAGLEEGGAMGTKSRPVSWSTSRIERDIFVLPLDITFTHTV
mmetsp:Transcript_26715/g.58162  ORF Transcript_26715/g.58162 Transcript_26715/m.58162 type:complete len:307 (-) Transcript_26715:1112-2032(-)